jgi:putative transposase
VTAPREILPDRTYFITRRCTQRQFLLRPSRRTNQIVEYCLALAASHTGVRLHAVCFMSNHWHGVVTDPNARLPEFLERFHRLVAKAQNASLGHWENLWSSEKTSTIPLPSFADIVAKMAYTIANPTSAGLVKSPDEWPGVISTCSFNERRIVAMPDVFFDKLGNLPKTTVLRFERPPIYPELSEVELAERIREATATLVRRAREQIAARGAKFLGAASVLRESWQATPKKPAPRRNPTPQVASQSTPRRVQMIEGLVVFARAYRQAWLKWRAGVRDVLFPPGTYALRIHAGVACAPS